MNVRDMFSHARFGALVAVSVMGMTMSAADSFTLAVRGSAPDCSIVLSLAPYPVELRAASELRDGVCALTGVTLPVVKGGKAARSVRISTVDDPALGEDGFRLAVENGELRVTGGRRGVLYGVFELLETYGGMGWFAPWRTEATARDVFAVPGDLRDEQRPAFALRDTSWRGAAVDPLFATRLRINGPRRNFPEDLGGLSRHRFAPGLGTCHTVERLMPPRMFAKEHPEYYGLVKGRRVTEGRVQLCLTNPDVLRICTERVLEIVRANPDIRYFGVSQGDSTGTVCKCPNCLASDHRYGDAPSGTFLAFVNAIAAEVEKVRPDAVVETLAYRYTRKPPVGIRPRHNVMPCLCTIECDFSRPIPESDFAENVAFVKDIRRWREISPFLYVWDYTVNFSHYGYPFADFRALQGNLRFFRSCGVEQIFEQGDGQGPHAWFGELRTWLLAKLEWNPEADVAALTDRFFRGYYGPAADLARADFEEIHALPRGGAADPVLIYEGVAATNYPDAFFERSAARWAEAERLVADLPEFRRAVRGGRFSTDYVRVMRHLIRSGRQTPIFLSRDPARMATPEVKELVAAAKRIDDLLRPPDPVRLSEGQGPNSNYVSRIRAFAAMKLPTAGVDSIQLGANDWPLPEWKAVRVLDADALGGVANHFDGTHHEWSGKLDAARLVVDPGAKFRVRVRLRADRTGRPGEIFRAGVYDPEGKRAVVPDFRIRDGQVNDAGYKWYDLFTWEPKGAEYLWISPGVYDHKKQRRNESFASLTVDRIELVRAE